MTINNTQLDTELDLDPMDTTPRLGWNPYEEVPEFLDPKVKIKHIQAPGVYIKTSYMPKGMLAVTKFFENDHVTILGSGAVVMEDGETVIKYQAPASAIFKKNTRYKITVLENSVWYSVHPTDETDLEVLRKKY